ncbi:ATP-binding protein [Piscinibacter sakaiensis]|uniref:ATP-binding protein n=1 Tax=Piscinibacter sakaiensis TaxID=1547922 RepID=UPI003AAB8E63
MTSIRLRLLLMLLAVLALAALLMGTVAYRTVLDETEILFDYQLRQMALSLRDQGEIAPDQARAFGDEELDFVIQIWTVDGRSIYASRRHNLVPARVQLGFADIVTGSEVWRTFSVASDDRVIQVAQPRRIRRELATDAALRSVAPLAVITPLLALLSWWTATLILRPLSAVAAAVRRRDAASLDALPTGGLPDEIAPLVGALNELLQRLGMALESQRAFVADAAHELRTPLTALKLQIGMLRRADDPAARRSAEQQLAAGIDRAARLVEQLLALARHEPGAAPFAGERLDLAELARGVIADLVPLAVAADKRLLLFAERPVEVDGDATALALLVRNLVDNALRHSPAGAAVEVTVDAPAGQPLLQVDDAGPGIPEADRQRVFDRFFRREPGDGDGSGLGLAIVSTIAKRHRASVELGDSTRGGLRASVRFPTADPLPAEPA